jgi:Domain of unknown function (DUF4352)
MLQSSNKEAKAMRKITLFLTLLFVGILLSGCVEPIPEKDILITVDKVEKRLYDDNGNSASSGKIYAYVFFRMGNKANQDLPTSSYYFKLKSPSGTTYDSKWIYSSGGSAAISVSNGAIESYYVAFEVDENQVLTSDWRLEYNSLIASTSANLENIKSGFHDIYLVNLTIDNYRYSNKGDSYWSTPAEGNTYIYFNITLTNSANNDDNIGTSSYNFKLYTTEGVYNCVGSQDGIQNEILPGVQASWYIYFEVPENATINRIEYDTWGIAPATAIFS